MWLGSRSTSFFPHVFEMRLHTVEFHVADNPVSICLFSTLSIVVISEDLLHLIHQAQPTVGSKFRIAFQTIGPYNPKKGEFAAPFSAFYHAIKGRSRRFFLLTKGFGEG